MILGREDKMQPENRLIQFSINNPIFDELIKNFGIKGVPTVVFLNPDGQERRDLRLIEFMGPAEFTKHMDKAF